MSQPIATLTTSSRSAPPALDPKLGRLIPLISLITLLLLAGLYHTLLADVTDDAYISFRYAANLVHGNGLVYNPGEYVEGYTNFLWVMTSALALWLGLDPSFTTYVLNALLGVGLLLLVGWFGHRMVAWGRVVPGWESLSIFVLASSSSLAFAMINGLETMLFTLLLTAACFSFALEQQGESRLPVSGLLFALCALTRPEGVLFWVLSVLYRMVTVRKMDTKLTWLISSFLLIWLPYIGWKASYYGSILPNTFYDKATSGNNQLGAGLGYVFSAWPYFVGPLAYAFALAVLFWRRQMGRIEGYFSLLVGVNFIYVAYVGGDYMEGYRFLMPTFPLFSLLVAASTAPLYQAIISYRSTRTVQSLLIIVFAAVGLSSCFTSGDTNTLSAAGEFNRNSGAVIDWLGSNSQPGDVLAIETIGRIPFYSGLYTIDMLGLTDAHIAHTPMQPQTFIPGHNKTDAAYVLSRQPTYILINHSPASAIVAQVYLPGSIAMVHNQQFISDYSRVATFALNPGVEGWIYKRKQGR